MNKNKAQQFIILLIFTIFSGCAKISSPTGGTRDRIPPKIVGSEPVDGEVNFKGDEIVIEFDEYVVLDNINDKFMVSPPMKQKPRVFTRGKSVRVQYQDTLRDSTTYAFYFMDAIRDLNEGNILPNYKIAFSTGSFIDSLSVTGNIYISPSLDAPEATTVLLFRNPEDTAVVKLFPDYLSRLDDKGYFRIDNVREGRYRLYALKDDDNSKNYNRVEESFGFLDSIITVTSENNFLPPEPDTTEIPSLTIKKKVPPPPVKITKTTASANKKPEETVPEKTGEYVIIMFDAQKTNHYLANTGRSKSYKLTYILSIPPDTMKFDFRFQDLPDSGYMIERSAYRDTVTVWLTDSTIYTKPLLNTIVKYPFTDTLEINGYKEDTIPMRFTFPKALRGGPKKTMLALQNNVTGGVLKPGQSIVFRAETPLSEPDTSLIRLYEILEKKRQSIPYSFIRDTSNSGKITLKARLAEGKQYLFIADSASISNIYNEHIDSTGIRFSVRQAASYSKLDLDISNSGGRSIVQLLDNNEKPIQQSVIEGDGKLTFSLLEKGTFKIRAISDLNGDGKWTTGDFFEQRQPEPVTYFPKIIEIPEGWDASERWDMARKNFKPQMLRAKPNNP